MAGVAPGAEVELTTTYLPGRLPSSFQSGPCVYHGKRATSVSPFDSLWGDSPIAAEDRGLK